MIAHKEFIKEINYIQKILDLLKCAKIDLIKSLNLQYNMYLPSILPGNKLLR